MIKGQIKADGIVVANLQANFLSQVGFEMKAEIKIVDSVDGRTCASAHVVNWPPEVAVKVKELVAAMEQAIGTVLFVNGTTPTSHLSTNKGLSLPRDLGGIGEFLGDDDPAL